MTVDADLEDLISAAVVGFALALARGMQTTAEKFARVAFGLQAAAKGGAR